MTDPSSIDVLKYVQLSLEELICKDLSNVKTCFYADCPKKILMD